MPKANIMPMYIVIDTSGSMEYPPEDPPIEAARGLLQQITDACSDNPILKECLWLEIITFDTTARVSLPGSFYREFRQAAPTFRPGGLTCYGKAFSLLRQELDNQMPYLHGLAKEKDMRLNRPAVFFITDGLPYGGVNGEYESDADRENAWKALSDDGYQYRPNLISLGINEADQTVLEHYQCGRHGGTLVVAGGQNAAKELRNFLDMLVKSIVLSGDDANKGSSAVKGNSPDIAAIFTGLAHPHRKH